MQALPRTASAIAGEADVRRLCDEAGSSPPGLRLAALVATLYYGCPRLGVALALAPADVDLAGARLVLRGRRAREVALEAEPLARLSRWMAHRELLGLGDAPLFCTFAGRRLDASYVRRALGALGRQTGTLPLSAEALRRAGAARLIEGGLDVADLQAHLDHGRRGVTVRYQQRLVAAWEAAGEAVNSG